MRNLFKLSPQNCLTIFLQVALLVYLESHRGEERGEKVLSALLPSRTKVALKMEVLWDMLQRVSRGFLGV